MLTRGPTALETSVQTHTMGCCPVGMELEAGKLVYSAVQTSTGRRVAVKFTQQYGREVHAAWGKAQLAPHLLSCDALPGGWLMVSAVLARCNARPLHNRKPPSLVCAPISR
jgi:hypothetical protein